MDGFKRTKKSINVSQKNTRIPNTQNLKATGKKVYKNQSQPKNSINKLNRLEKNNIKKTSNAKIFTQKSVARAVKKSKTFAKTWQKTRRKWYKIEKNTTKNSQKFLLAKFGNLRFVRKQTILWLGAILLILLGATGQIFLTNCAILTEKNAEGGNYIEGVIDQVATINPLFAASDSEKMLSKLVFPPLLKYDAQNNLSGNLAKNWTSEDGKTWRITLRDAIWSDGAKISPDDVIFTLEQMKNPDNFALQQKTFAKITTRKIDQKTLEIVLPLPLMNFPHRLTFGILPAHFFQEKSLNIREFSGLVKSENISGGVLRFDSKTANARTTTLKFFANKNYFRENMKLRSFSLKIYSDVADLEKAWRSGAISAIADAPAEFLEKIISQNGAEIRDVKKTEKSAPNPSRNSDAKKPGAENGNSEKTGAIFLKNTQEKISVATTRDGIFAIFNHDSPKLKDKNLRAALISATDRELLRNFVAPAKMANFAPEKLDAPIARGIFAEVDQLEQAKFDQKKAGELLDRAGWKMNGQFREKNGEIFTLRLVVPESAFYKNAAENLAEQWKKVGVKTEISQPAPSKIQANYLIPRDYDVLIYQLHLGSDPDATAYWSSSQADAQGLNLANWRNNFADAFLSSGLRQTDAQARAASYREFAAKWIDEAASMALYRANFYYVARENVRSFIWNAREFSGENSPKVTLSDLSDRGNSVANWTAKTDVTRVTP